MEAILASYSPLQQEMKEPIQIFPGNKGDLPLVESELIVSRGQSQDKSLLVSKLLPLQLQLEIAVGRVLLPKLFLLTIWRRISSCGFLMNEISISRAVNG